MTRIEYEKHLLHMGAKMVGDNPMYRRYKLGDVEIQVYINRAMCSGKELCLFTGEEVS